MAHFEAMPVRKSHEDLRFGAGVNIMVCLLVSTYATYFKTLLGNMKTAPQKL